jgi:hypothetical protein
MRRPLDGFVAEPVIGRAFARRARFFPLPLAREGGARSATGGGSHERGRNVVELNATHHRTRHSARSLRCTGRAIKTRSMLC